ncbi:peptidyl-prolyl cis-trans isomerase FKBP5-like isoform X6 [Neoarius graeffei]|uniref:peptidyl-prolyl cis-trans isomerase FKBP5-like isoform X6 n=1 Tax=Neoarius graeffei TaxID=443677 RepID=UPI00298C9311|nr:peptidyl-prolyl cis-trans isomerase FKBP5-like isoform X6 [Neoarius graeffei]
MRGTGDKREILGTRACLEEMAKFEDVCPTAQSFIGLFASQGLDITPNKDRGVCKIVKRHGTESEKPMIGDKVCVRYTGKFLNGKTFDSSLDQKEPFVFNVGKGHVIKAWDIGVHSMQKGEVCILMCKPEYAYGSVGIPPKIPPNSTLLFEVELLSFRGEELTEDGGILRRIKVKGEGYNNPNDGATVHVHLEGRCGGRLFDSRDATFVVGESEDVGVPLGVDRAMEKMQKGECCLLYLKPKYGYGKEGKRELDIGPNAELLYEVTLKDFQLAKQSWEMDLSEKLEQAVLVKQKGTQYFKTDASDTGLGAVLLQGEPGERHPVAYISWKLYPREVRYATVEKECLAVKRALDAFRYYLLGREFLLETDHRPLQWMDRMRDSNACITRWYLSMQPF